MGAFRWPERRTAHGDRQKVGQPRAKRPDGVHYSDRPCDVNIDRIEMRHYTSPSAPATAPTAIIHKSAPASAGGRRRWRRLAIPAPAR